MNLDRRSWSELAQRIKANNYDFFDPPHVRMEGMPGEHATLFVVDPSGNAMEFKAFRNHREVFSRVFDPQTSEAAGLQHLAADAAARTNAN
jgi:extradiol dioxygenase family protein